MLRPALVLSIALALGACVSNPDQELNSLRIDLRQYDIIVTNEDLADLSPNQRAELHFLLTSSSEFQNGGWIRTRQRALFILSREPATL